ncbi:MAG: hypothetical protein HQM12_20675 [SAR324 cluster bacterium]|nr:hypothetical protein [SAR324 cluster bacterium]
MGTSFMEHVRGFYAKYPEYLNTRDNSVLFKTFPEHSQDTLMIYKSRIKKEIEAQQRFDITQEEIPLKEFTESDNNSTSIIPIAKVESLLTLPEVNVQQIFIRIREIQNIGELEHYFQLFHQAEETAWKVKTIMVYTLKNRLVEELRESGMREDKILQQVNLTLRHKIRYTKTMINLDCRIAQLLDAVQENKDISLVQQKKTYINCVRHCQNLTSQLEYLQFAMLQIKQLGMENSNLIDRLWQKNKQIPISPKIPQANIMLHPQSRKLLEQMCQQNELQQPEDLIDEALREYYDKHYRSQLTVKI